MTEAHDPSQDHDKEKRRQSIREILGGMTDTDRHTASVAACTRLMGLDAFIDARVVMLYMPLPTELDVTPIALRCFQSIKTVCVPSVNWRRREMRPVEVTSFDDDVMNVDEHGLRVPHHTRPVLPSLINLIIVPGMAFDVHGNRLGRGGGYFDRFLPTLPTNCLKIGIAFDSQIVDDLPVNQHDAMMDVVVTDRRVTGRVRQGRHGTTG